MFDSTNKRCYLWLTAGRRVLATFFLPVVQVWRTKNGNFDMVIRNNKGVSLGSTTFTVGALFPGKQWYWPGNGHTPRTRACGKPGTYQQFYEGSFIQTSTLQSSYAYGRELCKPAGVAGLLGILQAPNVQRNNLQQLFQRLYQNEMTPLVFKCKESANDECQPVSPTTVTLERYHCSVWPCACTSNKKRWSQSNDVNCSATVPMYHQQYLLRVKTNAADNNTLKDNHIKNTTLPSATQMAVPARGIRLALYGVSACPSGQAFPAPVKCATFAADGPLAGHYRS